jgi:radical SAM superfamily enzyme YgiQ (UPF0313 family)
MNMPVFLCIPPISSLVPYPAIPYLTSGLRANNQKVSTFDLNIKAFNFTLFHQGVDIKPGEVLINSNTEASMKWERVPEENLYSTMRDNKDIFEEIMSEEASNQLNYPISNSISRYAISEKLKLSVISDVWKICDRWFLEVADGATEQSIVGFHVITQIGLLWSVVLAKSLKKILPQILTVLGGPAFLEWNEVLLAHPEIDLIARGEGEITISELADSFDGSLESIKGIKGISYRNKKNKIIINEDRPLIESLDALPFPNYDDLPLREYPQNKFGMPIIPVVGSRGCIGNCVFCVEKRLWGNTYRTRTPENIVSEFKSIKEKYKTPIIRFNDSLLNRNINSLETFCDLLIKENIGMQWMGNARIRPEMTSELLSKMHQAGCMGLWYGIESGSQRILNKMKKGYGLETARKVIQDTARNGIRVLIFMIVDFPGETASDFEQSVDFLQRNRDYIDQVSISRFGVLHDSEIAVNPQKYGIEVTKRKIGSIYGYGYSPVPQSNRYETLNSVWRQLSKQKTTDQVRNNPIRIIVPYF